jgi:hypothetical protein
MGAERLELFPFYNAGKSRESKASTPNLTTTLYMRKNFPFHGRLGRIRFRSILGTSGRPD